MVSSVQSSKLKVLANYLHKFAYLTYPKDFQVGLKASNWTRRGTDTIFIVLSWTGHFLTLSLGIRPAHPCIRGSADSLRKSRRVAEVTFHRISSLNLKRKIHQNLSMLKMKWHCCWRRTWWNHLRRTRLVWIISESFGVGGYSNLQLSQHRQNLEHSSMEIPHWCPPWPHMAKETMYQGSSNYQFCWHQAMQMYGTLGPTELAEFGEMPLWPGRCAGTEQLCGAHKAWSTNPGLCGPPPSNSGRWRFIGIPY